MVGLALDADGIPAAKRYYNKSKVTFPALVDPNYATRFEYVPRTFFINEHGVVQKIITRDKGWESLIQPDEKPQPVTDIIRNKWTTPGKRFDKQLIEALIQQHKTNPKDIRIGTELASRYIDSKRYAEARLLLNDVVNHYNAKQVVRNKDKQLTQQLAQAYFQLSRANVADRKAAVKCATMSFYLHPTIGYGKQIARIIAPEKFDRPDGRFDNRFREGTLKRLRKERTKWLTDLRTNEVRN